MIIPLGPRKGEAILANFGCKCADIKLAKEAIRIRKKIKMDKLYKIFNDNSIINRSLKTATFRSYKPTTPSLGESKSKLMAYAKEFNKDLSKNLVLVGDFGTCKSHLAVIITKQLLRSGHTCLFLSVPKLMTKIKQTYSGSTTFNEADILDLIADVDLFVLDDLGTEYTNFKNENDNWTHTKLFEVLDSRSGKPTIFTTNLSSEQLREKVNSRNLSRIMENTEVIDMGGTD